VPRLGRANEVVVGDIEQVPRLAEFPLHPIAVRERIEPFLAGLAVDVLGVLVIAHDEQGLEPREPLVARDGVRGDLLVRGPEVRTAVDVVNRRRQIKARRHIRTIVSDGAVSVLKVLKVLVGAGGAGAKGAGGC
jgi:hypothetical protein